MELNWFQDSSQGSANTKSSQKYSKRIEQYKKFVRLCGLRLNYVKLFANVAKEEKKIKLLLNTMREAGLEGKFC